MDVDQMNMEMAHFFVSCAEQSARKNRDYHPDKVAMLEILQTASGVGPRVAQAVLGVLSPDAVRIAVAAGLCAGPDVLLLDEPTAGQDPDAVEALFRAVRAARATVVFATHDLAVAARHAHRTVRVGR